MDFKRLRTIPITDVATRLGYKLRQKGSGYRAACLICNHPSPRAFSLTPRMGRYWCFGGCRAGGDVLQLVIETKKLTHVEAAEWLTENFKPP